MKDQRRAGVVLAYANIAANALVGVCYTPLMLRLLGQSEYGLYTLVASIVSYLSLFNFGAGSAYLRFYARYRVRDDERGVDTLNGTFLIIFTLMGLAALLCGTVLTSFSDAIFGAKLSAGELGTAKILMLLMVINMALTFPVTVFNAIVSAQERYVFQRTLTLLTTLLGPFVTLPLLLLGYRSVMIVVVSSVLTVAQLCVNIYFCRVKIGAKFRFGVPDFHLIGEIFGFSFFIFLNMIIDQVNWNVDKFLLGRFHGTGEVAVYGVASQINAIFMTFSTSVSSVFAPRINRIVAKGGGEGELNRLFIRVGRVQMMVLSLLTTGFLFFGRRFIALWAGDTYGAAYATTLLLVLPAMIPLIQNLGIDIQRARNKHQFRSLVYLVIALMNIVISIPLCSRYGCVGCALGTAIAVLIGNGVIMNWYYAARLDMDIGGFWRSMLRFVPSFVVPAAVGILMNIFVDFSNLGSYLVCMAVYTCIFCVSLWLLGMLPEERELFSKPFLKRMPNRKKNAPENQ